MSKAGDQLSYLYAVLEPRTPAANLLARGQVPGIDPDGPLFPVEAAGLMAAVSRVPAAGFQEEPLNALLADLPRLAPLAVRHEAAVRALLEGAPALIPMAFGAVYRSPQRVRALLEERSAEFRRLLDRLRGRVEWGLKVFGDTRELLAATAGTSREGRRLQAEAGQAAPGRAYLLTKRRERLLEGEAWRLAEEALEAILSRLTAISADHRRDAPDGEPTTERPLLLKAAFLVERSQEDSLAAVGEALGRTYAPLGLHVEVTGPWAPYSFVGSEPKVPPGRALA